ncbi:MAG: hypothetical protein MJ107_00255 [Lachnospiraceae bacterium]|nr:hypothetical protein [Lachnospiraceae bacterium]
MKSKKQLFDKTIFGKLIISLWPVWSLASLFGVVMTISSALRFRSNMLFDYTFAGRTLMYEADAEYFSAASTFVIYAALIYALVVGIGVYSFLFSKRSTIFMHSLPFSRDTVYISVTAAGLLMTVVPFVISEIVYTLMLLPLGIFRIKAIMILLWAIIAYCLIFFGLSALAAQFAGRLISFIAMYGILNFFFFFAEMSVTVFQSAFLYGVNEQYGNKLDFLIPVARLVDKVYYKYNYVETNMEELKDVSFFGLGTITVYGLVGVVLLVFARFVYKYRKSEASSEMLTIDFLKPVLLYAFSFIGAIAGAYILYGMFAFGNYQVVKTLPMLMLAVICGGICFFVGSMIINRDLRVFNRPNLAGFSILAAVLVIATFVAKADIFKQEDKMLSASEVDYVTVYLGGVEYVIKPDEPLFDYMQDIQKAIIEEGPRGNVAGEQWAISANFLYRLQDGGRFTRDYVIKMSEDNLSDPNSLESILLDFMNTEPVREKQLLLTPDYAIEYIDLAIYREYGYRDINIEKEKHRGLLDAVCQDLREGNIPKETFFSDYNENQYTLQICGGYGENVSKNEAVYDMWTQLVITKDMVHTIEYLETECGVDFSELK